MNTYTVTAHAHRTGAITTYTTQARSGDAAYVEAYAHAPKVFGSCDESRALLTTVRIDMEA